ncbi:MAG TPA: D-hexose-6-phosphate mutarotase [Anaerolineae bacterium]|nr:D-hexose-6-phosphate mutarotase [Anaerolineae bacterium]
MDMAPFITPGTGGLGKVDLAAADGAATRIYLHGAHVTSWIPAGGEERLFLSQRAEYQAGKTIRGGIPVVFPQFSSFGPLLKHGFARAMAWQLIDVANGPQAAARLRLVDTDETRAIWPHPFSADLTVSVGGSTLTVELAVANTGPASFNFTAALHTYLRVDDIQTTTVQGLTGLRYLDTAADKVQTVDSAPAVRFSGEVDRVYFDAPRQVHLVEPRRTTTIGLAGFPDAVVWNPGPVKGAALADLEPDGYRRMVCVEAVALGQPVLLEPGQSWSGRQTLNA